MPSTLWIARLFGRVGGKPTPEHVIRMLLCNFCIMINPIPPSCLSHKEILGVQSLSWCWNIFHHWFPVIINGKALVMNLWGERWKIEPSIVVLSSSTSTIYLFHAVPIKELQLVLFGFHQNPAGPTSSRMVIYHIATKRSSSGIKMEEKNTAR